jgi:hypothetical protein
MSVSVLVAICVGGTLILGLIIALVILLLRTKATHNRLLADLEQRGLNLKRPMKRQVNNALTTVPRHVLRRSTFLPFGPQSGWNALNSREDVSAAKLPWPVRQNDTNFQKSSSTNLITWPFLSRTSAPPELPLNVVNNARLSAIIESPAIMRSSSPSLSANSNTINTTPNPNPFRDAQASQVSLSSEQYCSSPFLPTLNINSTESLKPKPLRVSKTKKAKRNRAQTIGTTVRLVRTSLEGENAARRNIYSHARSFSLGSQNPGTVPHDPAPPLPRTISFANVSGRPKSWIDTNKSRLSDSSFESIGSSFLAASPRVNRTSSVWLKDGPKHDYTNSLIIGPRPLHRNQSIGAQSRSSPDRNLHSLRGSIRSNPDRLSTQSAEGTVLPRNESNLTTTLHSPISKIATAETVRMSRVSLSSTAGKTDPLRVLSPTPRRESRFIVAPNGSPAQRKTGISVLRDMPGGQYEPKWQPSQTSSRASSTRSSNGNPFQWDPSPMASGKPSSLKGSPSSRNRGHRRQNCVRIQLSPQIMGGPGKSPSPIMAEIREESPDTNPKIAPSPIGLGFSSCRALPQPPSTSTFAPELKLRPTTLRASLTHNSPTLDLVCLSSDSAMLESNNPTFTSSPKSRLSKRQSTTSIFTIPTFPSPGKTILTTNVMPTPTFSFSRPSNEFDECRSPPAEFKLLAKPIAPDSPLADIMIEKDDRPEFSTPDEVISPLFPNQGENGFKGNDIKNSLSSLSLEPTTPPLLPPTISWTGPPRYRDSVEQISPPCSPNSIVPPLERTAMQPETPLSPPEESPINVDNPTTTPLDHSPSSISASTSLAQTTAALIGPRNPPGKSIRTQIRELRRMNSDANGAVACGMRATKRYARLGREASPDQSLSRQGSWVSVSAAMGASGTRDSIASLCELDCVFEGNPQENEKVMDTLGLEDDATLTGDNSETSAEKHEEDVRVPGRIADWRNSNGESSVWKDGEQFWDQKPRVDDEVDDGLPLATTTNSQNKISGGSKTIPQRISQMRKSAIIENKSRATITVGTPLIKVLPPSSEHGTPVSLYDENGFLMR